MSKSGVQLSQKSFEFTIGFNKYEKVIASDRQEMFLSLD